jgi:methylmalonyl-CoA/ethylmalonyl-CoA epimerase
MNTAPGLNLHHVGYAAQNIEAIVANYVALYGYVISTPIIHDPHQTALVQFLKLPGDQSYLEFVAPDGPQSKLSSAIREGGGLNHLCFTSGPLEATILHLEQNKMKLISDPKPGVAFAGRRICWLLGKERLPIELVERRDQADPCHPGVA